MNFWGKLIGGVLGYMMGGLFGGLIGAMLGHHRRPLWPLAYVTNSASDDVSHTVWALRSLIWPLPAWGQGTLPPPHDAWHPAIASNMRGDQRFAGGSLIQST